MKTNAGPSTRLSHYLNLQPAYTGTDTGAKRLGRSFFGGEPGCKALCRFALAQAVGLFRIKIDTVEETPSVAIHRVMDARNLHHVNSGAGNHAIKLQHSAFPAPSIGKTVRRGCARVRAYGAHSITTARVTGPLQGHGVSKTVKRRSTPQQLSFGLARLR